LLPDFRLELSRWDIEIMRLAVMRDGQGLVGFEVLAFSFHDPLPIIVLPGRRLGRMIDSLFVDIIG